MELDDTHPSLTFTGTWDHLVDQPGAVNGTLSQSRSAGSTVKVIFNGTSITVYGVIYPGRQRSHPVSTYVIDPDGNSTTLFRFAPAVPEKTDYNAKFFESPELTPGLHTLLINVTNDGRYFLDSVTVKNETSSGPGAKNRFSKKEKSAEGDRDFKQRLSSNTPVEVIVGAVIGSIVGLLLLVLIVVMVRRRRRAKMDVERKAGHPERFDSALRSKPLPGILATETGSISYRTCNSYNRVNSYLNALPHDMSSVGTPRRSRFGLESVSEKDEIAPPAPRPVTFAVPPVVK
ncbi:unnamed protein product [Cyclocybe aegerita]|uniref:Uncharacterized protein n=1 Tax=Cyclocybe aegerita TaxID=1973307 RepID=A0A8S0XFY8_CYCAE|nr:unnamed protein product [Cyclocybe aegerita]